MNVLGRLTTEFIDIVDRIRINGEHQWLCIVRYQYKHGSWPLDIWPQRMKASAPTPGTQRAVVMH